MSVSIGEALVRRKLDKHETGYLAGQYHASRLGPNDVLLSWVDRSGNVCIVPCELRDGEWFQRQVMVTADQLRAGTRTLGRGFALTEEMIRAIQSTMTKKKAPRRPDKSTGSQQDQES